MPAEPPEGQPREIAAILKEPNSLVVLDPGTGAIVRTLVPCEEGRFLGALSLSPDEDTVYFDASVSNDRPSQVFSVATGGGDPALIADGELNDVSPDGKHVALTRQAEPETQIVVRNLSTGEEHVWSWQPEPQTDGGVYFAGWLPDSQRFLYGGYGVDPPGHIGGVVKLSDESGKLDGSGVGPGDDEIFSAWESATQYDSTSIAIAAKQDSGGPSPTRIEIVDARRLERKRTVLSWRKDAYEMDFDDTARHLLLITRSGLYRWHGGKPIRVRRDVRDAAWVS